MRQIPSWQGRRVTAAAHSLSTPCCKQSLHTFPLGQLDVWGHCQSQDLWAGKGDPKCLAWFPGTFSISGWCSSSRMAHTCLRSSLRWCTEVETYMLDCRKRAWELCKDPGQCPAGCSELNLEMAPRWILSQPGCRWITDRTAGSMGHCSCAAADPPQSSMDLIHQNFQTIPNTLDHPANKIYLSEPTIKRCSDSCKEKDRVWLLSPTMRRT